MIEGPKLVELTVSDGCQGYIERLSELHFVALANQDTDMDWPFLRKAPRLKCLKLSAKVAEVLVSSRSISDYARTFAQIRRLEICVDIDALLKLLQVMPCLEFLKLNLLKWWYKGIDEQDQEPLRVCIASHSHLKEVEFINFLERNTHLHLINLLLENVKSLERVTVCFGENMISKVLHDGKNVRAVGVQGDFISSLPDYVISHILSRLPTKDAVKTSVLSQQWKYKYASISNIDIEVEGGVNCETCVRSSGLHSFIDQLLAHYDSRIVSFRLVSRNERCCLHNSVKWIPQILNRNVQKLVIESSWYDMLKCLHVVCTSLTTLNISMNGVIQFPDENYFPNLKSLYLGGFKDGTVQIQNEVLIFPALEVLEMNECAFPKVEFVEINVPELITFKYEYSKPERRDCEIKICGPKLAKLHYSCGDFIEPYVPYWERPLFVFRYPGDNQIILASRASALLNGAPSLKCLTLSCAVAEALAQRKDVIPSLHQFIRLEISCHTEDLLKLLQLMPCLESLKLSIPYWHHKRNQKRYWPKYKQKEPLPLCVAVPCLKEVEFIYFYGGSNQIDLIKLFVENVKCLERVIVCLGKRPRDSKPEITSLLETLQPIISEKEIRGLLSTLKPANSSCIIVFK